MPPPRGLAPRRVYALRSGRALTAGRGLLWPLAGFSVWHLAPQVVLPARLGRGRFVAGATVVGAISSAIAWRTGGVRGALPPHIATDACGVTAARFRLGR